jgi:hypothetical protein
MRTPTGRKRRDDKSNDGRAMSFSLLRTEESDVVRPFVYDELVARMRAVLRRTTGPRHPRLSVRELEIDLASRVVTLAGEAVQLSAKEYELLVALAEDVQDQSVWSNRGHLYPRLSARRVLPWLDRRGGSSLARTLFERRDRRVRLRRFFGGARSQSARRKGFSCRISQMVAFRTSRRREIKRSGAR